MEIVLIRSVQYTLDYATQSFNKDLMRGNCVPDTPLCTVNIQQ